MESAAAAIGNGIMEPGRVMIIDWQGREHIV